MPERTNADWLTALDRPEGPDPSALVDLRAHLERAALFAIRRRLASSPDIAADEIASLAEDSAQEALLQVLKGLPMFRGEARFVTWACAIAVAVAQAALRRRLWRDLSLERVPDGWQAPTSSVASRDGWEHPHLATQRAEMWSVIQSVVNSDLTDRQRQVLNLVVINGVEADEVAERLDITPGALYKLTHDARRKLKAGLIARGFSTTEILAAFSAQA